MDLPLYDFIGKKNNNIVIRTLYFKDCEKCIMRISHCIYVFEDNSTQKTNLIIEQPQLKYNNISYNKEVYFSLRDFVEKFIEYQKTKGWKYDLEYKCEYYTYIDKLKPFEPINNFKDNYIITFTK